MPRVRHVLAAAIVLMMLGASNVRAEVAARRSPVELAQAVERRAGATDFSQLEAFGRAAIAMRGRESLNRLYHVTWIFLNQGNSSMPGAGTRG